jgi:hypothetical protein
MQPRQGCIFLFTVYLTTLLITRGIQRRTMARIMTDEWEIIWQEALAAWVFFIMHEESGILQCDTVSDELFSTFRKIVIPLSSRLNQSKKNLSPKPPVSHARKFESSQIPLWETHTFHNIEKCTCGDWEKPCNRLVRITTDQYISRIQATRVTAWDKPCSSSVHVRRLCKEPKPPAGILPFFFFTSFWKRRRGLYRCAGGE